MLTNLNYLSSCYIIVTRGWWKHCGTERLVSTIYNSIQMDLISNIFNWFDIPCRMSLSGSKESRYLEKSLFMNFDWLFESSYWYLYVIFVDVFHNYHETCLYIVIIFTMWFKKL